MSEKLLLAQHGTTKYSIVVPRETIPAEVHAAEELKRFLGEITGAEFPVIFDDETNGTDKEILLGYGPCVDSLHLPIHIEDLGQEGFSIMTYGNRILIVGGRPRGTLYGVYTFLEKYLGCRWFTPRVSRIPKRCCLELPEIELDTQVPVLEYRDPFCAGNMDADWHARNKSNSTMPDFSDAHGYKMEYYPFVHTFDLLLPPDEYYETHPEYYALVDGKRLKERTQLCLTNPEVLQIAIARVREWLQEHPKAQIVSVSQNDCFQPCECDNCRAIDEREGSHAGTLIEFVNKVAEAIEPDYPNVIIDTLAYTYTRKPPKTVRPRHNVAVRLCSIECCFSHPLSESGLERNHVASFASQKWARGDFAEDMRGWAKICNRLHIWDYTTNFAHYLSPFPDFKVIGPNIRFFIENHATGIFEEGNNSREGSRLGELNEMRQYVEAKLLWDPSLDTDMLVNEFLTGVYGNAAAPMRAYYDLMHEQVADKDMHMGIYDPPTSPYLGVEFIQKADELFDQAERLADDDRILEDVRLARLSIRYLKLVRMPVEDPDRAELVEEFADDLRSYGFAEIREGVPLETSLDVLRRGEIQIVNA